jgi:hypothetical protein
MAATATITLTIIITVTVAIAEAEAVSDRYSPVSPSHKLVQCQLGRQALPATAR